MAVNINVPSQVKTYANLAAFPATGALKTIYIAEDNNKTYRWTGSVYTEISASAAMTWGAIGGTLSNQTDLQNALDAKVPTSRTLTINGVTQDLSANRTFTISTGITIGSTAIASGVVGRVLFEGAGNVVQESSSLFWDDTNARLGIGTSTPSSQLHVLASNSGASSVYDGTFIVEQASSPSIQILSANTQTAIIKFGDPQNGQTGRLQYSHLNNSFGIITNSAEQFRIFSTGNVLIQNGGTFTDAGFRLDVNGNARVQGNAQFGTGFYWDNTNGRVGIGTSTPTTKINIVTPNNGDALRLEVPSTNSTVYDFYLGNSGTTSYIRANPVILEFRRQGTPSTIRTVGGVLNDLALQASGGITFTTYDTNERMRIIGSTGNVLIGTTTDAGFRLDVNGTARVSSTTTTALTITQGASGDAIVIQNGGYIQMASTRFRAFATTFQFQDSSFNTKVVLGMTGFSYFNSGANYTFGSTTDVASALVNVDSTTKGFLPPRMTTTQKNAIASPAAGLMVYDTTLNVISYYNGSMWI